MRVLLRVICPRLVFLLFSNTDVLVFHFFLLQLIKTLSDVLYHGANSAVVRQQAGVQLKNFLYTNDESLRAQYEQRWLEMPEEVRVYTKNNVLGSLGTESFRPSAAAQCIQLIAMAELPRQMWPNLLTTLVQVNNHYLSIFLLAYEPFFPRM